MKIGIVTDNIDKKSAGAGSYSKSLVNALLKIDKKNEYTFIHKTFNHYYKNKKEIIIKSIENPAFYALRKFIIFPIKLQRYKFDIVHDTYHFFPIILNKNIKKIVTILDIIPLINPKNHRFISFVSHKLLLKWILKRVDKIITISENTKKDLIKFLNIPENKIKTILLAADDKYKKLPPSSINKIKKKYNINFKYILYVGTLEIRKNVPSLLKAYSQIKDEIDCKLLIVGKIGWKYKEIFEIIEKCKLKNDVIFLGYVKDEDLPYLYNGGELFVYPSLYEGFGLPPLEAMACGCPVITSNTSSIPEVVGNAGIMVNPYDTEELARYIKKVLKNKNLKNKLIKKGFKQAKKFSWEKCAMETLKVYEEVHNEK